MNAIFDMLLESDGGNLSLKPTTLSRLEFLLQSYELCDIWRIRNKIRKGTLADKELLLFKEDLIIFLCPVTFKIA